MAATRKFRFRHGTRPLTRRSPVRYPQGASLEPAIADLETPFGDTEDIHQTDLSMFSSPTHYNDTHVESTDSWPIANPGQQNTTGSWWLPTLFEKDQLGKERFWQIGFDSSTEDICVEHGRVGGKITDERRAVEVKGGKSVQEQAFQDAKYKYIRKTRKGHRPRGDNTSCMIPAQEAVKYMHPDLGVKYRDKKPTTLYFPVWMDLKLDGIRARIFTKNGKVKAVTRENVDFSSNLNSHLFEIERLFAYLPPNVGLDGEWYSTELPFGRIQGATMCKNSYNEDLKLVQLWIFDIIVADVALEERWDMLKNAYDQYIEDYGHSEMFRLVEKTIVHNHDEIIQFHNRAVEDGFEGAMIRHPLSSITSESRKIDSYYRGKRNKALLKVKAFVDEEFRVIGVNEAKGRDRGTAIFELEISPGGKRFTCRPTGDLESRRYWFDHQEECIGRLYTVEFFEKSKDNIPRFPVGKAFRDEIEEKGTLSY
jgi:ATP dependent DNA ligase-like protein